jgi:hypothetical protein
MCILVYSSCKNRFWEIQFSYFCFLSSCDRASWQILIIKQTRCTNFSNLLRN